MRWTLPRLVAAFALTQFAGIQTSSAQIVPTASEASLQQAAPNPAPPAAAPPASQQGGPKKGAGLDAIEQARAELEAAEAAHPGNTVEICEALDKLVGLLFDAHLDGEETMALVKREVAVAEAGPGPRSKQYVSAIDELAQGLTNLDKPGEARPYAEKALQIATETMPDSPDFSDVANTLGLVCNEMGDYPCAQRAFQLAVDSARKIPIKDAEAAMDLAGSLSNLANVMNRQGDHRGAIVALEEALTDAQKYAPQDRNVLIIENNLGSSYSQNGDFEKAIPHLNKAVELTRAMYGDDSPRITDIEYNIAALYGRSGQFDLSWKYYERVLAHSRSTGFAASQAHSTYARSLASGGSLAPAIEQGLIAARMGRENFVLVARTLPERQALAFDRLRAKGLDLSVSVLAKHPEMVSAAVYQEVIRCRALVADEMARRQKNLNRNNDPELARLLKELEQARSALLALEQSDKGKAPTPGEIAKATEKMESAEAAVAQRSAAFRNDERVTAVALEDVRRNIPKGAVLISYVRFGRSSVEKVDPLGGKTPAYAAFVYHPESGQLHIFDLGDATGIEPLIEAARKTVDVEMQSGGIGGKRNERAYRDAAGALRTKVWDPLRAEFAGASLLLVVPDGLLNLIPFAAFPDGDGYWIDHGPMIHLLSSERDLIPEESTAHKSGLLAIGNPTFNSRGENPDASPRDAALPQPDQAVQTRSATLSCDEFRHAEFHPLPQTALEVSDISAQWQAANSSATAEQLLGPNATRESFLRDAVRGRVLHVATHAFLLSQSCGDGNPLLHSGLVFAGANSTQTKDRENSLLTAQEIAAINLEGVDWAVLSACNTGAGEVRDGEGVLGLQRAFRLAGAHSVIMTLWPVDDDMSRRYMHELYSQRFGHNASTAQAVWNASRKLLAERRASAAQLSTHPWYWAGFVGSGSWE